ncbi:GDYXXLXY domain-containing protein [Gallaecimonas sp. GXIMD4217]|uniref:GDYXXLXY domain-containing protein n=1 Tax=Gallaecimonas sp. GXIMD4217 TaxID=3131927 RepID=UPI00311AD8A7
MIEVIRSWTPANRPFVAIGLALAIALQMAVLAGEYLGSVWPLWYGKPVKLETVPLDPRSLFRGNYVRLRYRISAVDKALSRDSFRRGEVAYVRLEKEGDYHIAVGLQKDRPDSGTFIRGRITGTGGNYRLNYGIEAYFLPKDKAKQAEKAVRSGAWADIYLLPSGKAAIADLHCRQEAC